MSRPEQAPQPRKEAPQPAVEAAGSPQPAQSSPRAENPQVVRHTVEVQQPAAGSVTVEGVVTEIGGQTDGINSEGASSTGSEGNFDGTSDATSGGGEAASLTGSTEAASGDTSGGETVLGGESSGGGESASVIVESSTTGDSGTDSGPVDSAPASEGNFDGGSSETITVTESGPTETISSEVAPASATDGSAGDSGSADSGTFDGGVGTAEPVGDARVESTPAEASVIDAASDAAGSSTDGGSSDLGVTDGTGSESGGDTRSGDTEGPVDAPNDQTQSVVVDTIEEITEVTVENIQDGPTVITGNDLDKNKDNEEKLIEQDIELSTPTVVVDLTPGASDTEEDIPDSTEDTPQITNADTTQVITVEPTQDGPTVETGTPEATTDIDPQTTEPTEEVVPEAIDDKADDKPTTEEPDRPEQTTTEDDTVTGRDGQTTSESDVQSTTDDSIEGLSVDTLIEVGPDTKIIIEKDEITNGNEQDAVVDGEVATIEEASVDTQDDVKDKDVDVTADVATEATTDTTTDEPADVAPEAIDPEQQPSVEQKDAEVEAFDNLVADVAETVAMTTDDERDIEEIKADVAEDLIEAQKHWDNEVDALAATYVANGMPPKQARQAAEAHVKDMASHLTQEPIHDLAQVSTAMYNVEMKDPKGLKERADGYKERGGNVDLGDVNGKAYGLGKSARDLKEGESVPEIVTRGIARHNAAVEKQREKVQDQGIVDGEIVNGKILFDPSEPQVGTSVHTTIGDEEAQIDKGVTPNTGTTISRSKGKTM